MMDPTASRHGATVPAGYGDVHVTCGSEREAESIGDVLIRESLAACVQLHPVRSVFSWDGGVEHDEEIMLVAKTRSDRWDALIAAIETHHGYDLPAITFVETVPSHRTAAWIDEVLDDDREP